MAQPPHLSLSDWLAALDASAAPVELLLGGSGHLLLERGEEQAVAAQLRESVLPRLFDRPQPRPVCVLTGLAPGADLLFTRVVGDWLREAGFAYRVVGLLPLPAKLLLEDWALVAEAGELDSTETEVQRLRLAEAIRGCDAIVDLLPARVDPAHLQSVPFRQSQYRRLAACLAQRSDVLVAILRSDNPQRPGGTAEVVDWRRHPQRVPPEYSTWSAASGAQAESATASGRRLVLIDPTVGAAPAASLAHAAPATGRSYAARARAALAAGNYVHCYDLAEQARALGLDSPRLRYTSLLALANAGSTALAWRRYGELGLRGDERDEDWLALKGRLLKDLALAGRSANPPDSNRDGFRRAAQAYLAAYRLTGGHFTSINAATLFQLAGDTARARELAAQVLELLENSEDREASSSAATDDDADREAARYFRHVSEAEAALLLGDLPRTRRALALADPLLRRNLNARSRTRAQLRLLCEAFGLDDDELLGAMWLPEVIRARRCVAGAGPTKDFDPEADYPGALVFLALQEPGDLAAGEHFQRRGAHLHLVVPDERGPCVEHWRRQFGTEPAARLAALFEAAGDLTVARGFLETEDVWCQGYVAALADGLAVLAAARLGCRVRELNPHAAVPAADASEPAFAPVAGAAPRRRFAGLIFADIVGFRRLQDTDLPRFWEVVMGTAARLIDGFGARVLLRRTWGDALHVVTEDAVTAAELAIAIQDSFEALRSSETGALADIELRLAAHFAPVYEGYDPVADTPMYFGSQLNFTARIEPVTPPGMIFVTELFAARVMLDAPQAFRLEYAGELALAKRYGNYRLFNLRAAGATTRFEDAP